MIIDENLRRTKKQSLFLFALACFSLFNSVFSQEPGNYPTAENVSKLFQEEEVLSIKLRYSNKEVKFNTNDSTYVTTDMSYQETDGSWKSLALELRARGNFRRKNCFYAPIKMKIKKVNAKGTLFEGNKRLKLVLPCFVCKNADDFVVKEYLAYKMYESLAPYHFKTRLVSIDFTEIRGKRSKSRQITGILIEDVKNVANRHKGNVYKRHMNPMAQDSLTSVQNALFQFMIGNTDFSTTYQHNQKQLFVEGKLLPVPYDFDMSGFVNSDYAIVSKVQNRVLPIEEVTDRLYKGYQRDPQVFDRVRQAFVANKSHIFRLIEAHKALFKSCRQFSEAKDFISGFYRILENDKRFTAQVVNAARTAYAKRPKAK